MRLIYIILMYLLSSCGFTPLYSDANQKKLEQLESQITLVNNINKYDFSLGKKIIYKNFSQKFNFPKQDIKTKYILSVNNISESEYPLDLDMDGNASEYSYNININASLKDFTKNNKIIFSKSYNSKINLKIGNSYYSSVISKRNYQKKLAQNIAEKFYNEIFMFLY